ncbi:hypothetical protein GE09DRAFT_1162986 [Coniochaeta sp. 2T2.1]|nr:hypothetical protein GE09DRAFT_1162986 [Coniochaeta sp. 2T2.1]
MHLTTLATMLLPLLVAADFDIWTGTISDPSRSGDNPSGIQNGVVVAPGGSVCNYSGDKLCGMSNNDLLQVGSGNFEVGNPCNSDCGADTLVFRWLSELKMYDIVVKNTNTLVGICGPPEDSRNEACTSFSSSALYGLRYHCQTKYCQ